ncbi:Methylthioribose-1-phosphate isomerase [Folsomia candida]|uniref:Methylthioribose-1-phosphate isomerase n=1 Tax=Folsomia candida TaxID=158441 RepID=A0A226EVK9_FOLCA|nr:Methylthioribose-1-phosphate isomerase [Folsomia candida]
MENHLQSVKYKRGEYFQVLDQLKVPHELVYRDIKSVEDAVDAIKRMQVRGAPLIAIVGCFGIAIELGKEIVQIDDKTQLLSYIREKIQALIDARPTAVNMRKEGLRLIDFLEEKAKSRDNVSILKTDVLVWIEDLYKLDLETNKASCAIGKHGAEAILQKYRKNSEGKINVLTICNTGSLATSGYGTALGVIRALHGNGDLNQVYFTETRPYNQGSRLTAFELLVDKIPSTLICDSAVSWLMKNHDISAVIVGADRVVKNGDTANKIGTYQLAIAAKAHGVGFYVAAPFSSIDPTISTGDQIVIEERPGTEVTQIGTRVWNPAFDVTPANLITGIITEIGVFTPEELFVKLDN